MDGRAGIGVFAKQLSESKNAEGNEFFSMRTIRLHL